MKLSKNLERVFGNSNHLSNVFFLLLIVAFTVSRFWALDEHPKGFFIDEAVSVVNAICISELGTDAIHGESYPIFFRTEYNGINAPTYVYLTSLLEQIFGRSREFFRSISAAATLLTILGAVLLTKTLLTSNIAKWSLLAATISPWGFQYSRIAWENPLYPMFLIWALYLFLTGSGIWRSALAGFLFSMSAYSYGPARAAVPLVLVGSIVLRLLNNQRSKLDLTATLVTFALSSMSIFISVVDGSINSRWNQISVFSKYASDGLLGVLKEFLSNFFLHFSWDFIFLRGDVLLLRQTTHQTGTWSWLDLLGFTTAFLLLISRLIRTKTSGSFLQRILQRFYIQRNELFILFCLAATVTPSALTTDCQPHSLRAIAAWPFLTIFSAIGLETIERRFRDGARWILAIAILFSAQYLYAFFVTYPTLLKTPENVHWQWFSPEAYDKMTTAKSTDNWEAFNADKDVHICLKRYYQIAEHGQGCRQFNFPMQKDPLPFVETPLGKQIGWNILGLLLILALQAFRNRRKTSPPETP